MSEILEINSRDIFIYSLLEFSQFYSMNKLSKVLIDLNFNETINDKKRQTTVQLFNQLNGKLIEKVLPQFNDKYLNHNKILQVLVLSRSFQKQIKFSLDFVVNYNNNCELSHRYDNCIKWSFSQLNLVITSMAMISRHDKQFFDMKTNESFKPKFVDIYYKLKTLKVLSFLAVEPRLPIELLSVIISETFLWTEPTQLDVSVMQLHSRLISQFSNYVKDNNTFQTHMRDDFFSQLKECLRYVSTHFHSFIDYLVDSLGKTQIDLIVDQIDQKLICRLNEVFEKNQSYVHLFTEMADKPHLKTDEDFLIDFVTKSQSMDETIETIDL